MKKSNKCEGESSDDEYEVIRRRPLRRRKPIINDTPESQKSNTSKESDSDFDIKLKKIFDKSKNAYEIKTPTPSQTKRKLFTPSNLVSQNDKSLQINSPKPYLSSDEELLIGDDQKVTFKGNPFSFPALIKNKKIEAVKTGRPIFKLPTPKKNRKVPAKQTPTKPNTRPQKLLVQRISDSPYSFLKSLEGKTFFLF